MVEKGKRFRSQILHFINGFKIELASLVLVMVGVFLLTEEMDIRSVLYRKMFSIIKGLSNLFGSMIATAKNYLQNIHPSDVIGIILILTAFGLMGIRIREYILKSGRFDIDECPVCGSDLERIHRKTKDYLITLWIPLRRYACQNNTCNWTGLLH